MSDNFWLDARHCNFYIVKCGFCCISLKYCSGTQEVTWRAMWTFWGLFLRFIVGWIHSSFYSSTNLAHYWSATLLKMLPNAPSIRGSLYFDRWEYVFPDLWGTEIVWFTAFHSILSLSPKPLFKYSTDLLHPVQCQLVLNKTFKLLQVSEEFFFSLTFCLLYFLIASSLILWSLATECTEMLRFILAVPPCTVAWQPPGGSNLETIIGILQWLSW